MKINYMLCIQGTLGRAQLNIALNADDQPAAEAEAKRIALDVLKHGYNGAALYDVRDDEPHKMVKAYSLVTVDPTLKEFPL